MNSIHSSSSRSLFSVLVFFCIRKFGTNLLDMVTTKLRHDFVDCKLGGLNTKGWPMSITACECFGRSSGLDNSG